MESLTRTHISESDPAPVGLVTLAPDRNPAVVYLASLAPGSRRTMKAALKTVASLVTGVADEIAMPWQNLDYAHMEAVRSKLASTFAPATANRILAAVRGTLKTAFRLGMMSAEQLGRATSIEPVRGARVTKGRSLSPGEVRMLFHDCDPARPGGARDAAMLALAYGCGLRRSEVVGVGVKDVDLDSGAVRVLGKGNKERIVFLPSGARLAVEGWLGHRGRDDGPLLMPVSKGGSIVPRRMTDQAVAERLRLLRRRVGVQPFSAHDLRRTWVGELLDAGADIAVVQALAGHASPTTTARYDRRGARAQQRATEILHVPVRV